MDLSVNSINLELELSIIFTENRSCIMADLPGGPPGLGHRPTGQADWPVVEADLPSSLILLHVLDNEKLFIIILIH